MKPTENGQGAILEPGEFQWYGCPLQPRGGAEFRVRGSLAVVADKANTQPTFPGKVWVPQHWHKGGEWLRVLVWNDTAEPLAVFVAVKLELGGPRAGADAGRVMPAGVVPCEAPGGEGS